jgi:hypothetical protein
MRHSHVLDLHALMPYHSMTDEESRDKIWDDGLHFTPHGYSVMGDHIASRLVELMAESQGQTELEAKDEDGKQEAFSKEA